MAVEWLRGRRKVILLPEDRFLATDAKNLDPHDVGDFAYLYATTPEEIEVAQAETGP